MRMPSGRWRTGAALALFVALLQVAAPPASGSTGALDAAGVTRTSGAAAVAPVMDCAAVARLDLRGVTDGTVTIASATTVTDGATYCEVRGTIAPANTFLLRLPLVGWAGRYVQTGCGGLCGDTYLDPVQSAGCLPIADGTVAMASTDMGHQGTYDGSWAAGDPQAQIDFGYRGVHATAQVSKALIGRFYGRAPSRSYFDGCSDGGREGLMEAQRYPADFDGIAAGAPANDVAVQNTIHHGWNVLANRDAAGRAILLADKLPLVHDAVLAACDALDGLKDGQVDDPRRCPFQPSRLLCRSGQDASTCLSAAEAAVVQRLHDGATDAQGRRLEQAIAHEWGSELGWTLFVPATPDGHVDSEDYALGFLRYLADGNHPDPGYQLSDLKFTVASFWKVVQSSSYLAAVDPDLSAYAARGGKLLLWHGWNDEHITPQSTLAYYDAVRNTLGAARTDAFTRLYLFPGMAHCGGGEGPSSFDVMTPLMAWVEQGTAPGRIVATDPGSGRTRPVFPYPAVARYTGKGSTDSAANFTAWTPPSQPGPGYDWVGQRLYSHGYQTTCHAAGTALACTPASTWLTRLAG